MLSEFLKRCVQREAFKNVTVISAVYGIQVVVFKDIFRCPCSDHKSYGLTFLFIPAIFLFALSLMVCQKSWSVVATLLKQSNYKMRCNYFLSSLVEFFRPFLASASWIVVALLRGESYICIRAGPGKECVTNAQKIISIDFEHFYSQSFILGSACLIAMAIFVTGIVCIQRCCTNSFERLPTYDDMIRSKRKAIVAAFNIKTKELTNEYAEKLVENSFCARLDSELDVDERFIQAREKVLAICGHKLASGYMIDVPFSSMEITSSSTM